MSVKEVEHWSPAFPNKVSAPRPDGVTTDVTYFGGLTKREYFAGLAMSGVFASSADQIKGDDPETLAKAIAVCAVITADALLDELSKERTGA